MDTTSLIEIIIAVLVVFAFIKFIVSPVIKFVLGILIFLFLLYLLQRFFGIGLDKLLAPFGVSLDPNSWGLNFDWVPAPINYYMEQVKSFANYIWENYVKALKS